METGLNLSLISDVRKRMLMRHISELCNFNKYISLYFHQCKFSLKICLHEGGGKKIDIMIFFLEKQLGWKIEIHVHVCRAGFPILTFIFCLCFQGFFFYLFGQPNTKRYY